MRVAIVKADRYDGMQNNWVPVLKLLAESGVKVHKSKVESDVYLVLSGRFENPLCLRGGKRVLLYNRAEWFPNYNDTGWKWYKRLLRHYYADMVDCTELSAKEIVKQIECLKTANS
jgi:hypothetical protein